MPAEKSLDVPIFVIDPSRVFPEVPSIKQSTSDATRPVASLVIFVAFMLSGVGLTGVYADTPMEQIHKEIQFACDKYNVDIDRVFEWANNLLIDGSQTFTDAEREEFIPRHIKSKGFDLRMYQWKKAAWSAYRCGSILAMGCGIGKSGTATAAAIGAVRAKRCRGSRCHILAPVNAIPQWEPYCKDLEEFFEEVTVFSIDSAHLLRGMDRSPGGAIIYDELHKLKNDSSRRGDACEHLRNCYEWSVGLTGTLFNAGAEGVMRVQDMVLPGLSRFLDKWAFGEAFDCTFVKKIGKRKARALAMPSDAQRDKFVHYMSRGVASLSFDSEEVKEEVEMPEYDSIRIDSWEMPAWARELQVKLSKEDSRNQVYWGSDWTSDADTRIYLGAMALAEAEKSVDKKLPSFPAVMHAACKEGRFDRVITSVHENGKAEATFKWVYNPSAKVDPLDVDSIPAGPKIKQAELWLEENPKKPVIMAAVGTTSLYILAKMIAARGLSFDIIRGGVDQEDRKRIVGQFEDGKIDVCLIQQAAGSESITLIKAATSILIDHSWSSAIYTQFKGRNYRIGQTQDCEHYDYVFGTMQKIALNRLKRDENFDATVRGQIETRFWDRLAIETMKVA